jgi:hypothetical protein
LGCPEIRELRGPRDDLFRLVERIEMNPRINDLLRILVRFAPKQLKKWSRRAPVFRVSGSDLGI